MTNRSSRTTERGKLFELEEARKRLPYVQRISADIVRLYSLVDQAVKADRKKREAEGDEAPLEQCSSPETRDRIADLARCGEELDEIGVQLQDVKRGTVHFLSILNGKMGYYCWDPATEEQICRWHPEEEGCTGRSKAKSRRRAI